MDKLIITIVDDKRSHQFYAHKHLKKIIFFGILGFVVVVLLSFWLLSTLMNSIDEIALKQNIVLSEYRYFYNQNQNLKNQIRQKSDELSIVYQKIRDLESILSTQKNNKNIHQKRELGDVTQLDSRLKFLLLNLLPNGDPIVGFSSKSLNFSAEYPKRNQKLGYRYSLSGQTPILATADGVVEFVRTNHHKGYGNFVRINHSFGFGTLYAHVSKIVRNRGDFVKKGEVIAYASSSIYYEVLFLNKPLQSQYYVEWNLDHFDSAFQDESRDWGDLIYTLSDILKLKSYSHSDEKRGISVIEGVLP